MRVEWMTDELPKLNKAGQLVVDTIARSFETKKARMLLPKASESF